MKEKSKTKDSDFVTITRTDKGILFEPNENLMDALGFHSNPTFVPFAEGEKAYLVGDIRKRKRKGK